MKKAVAICLVFLLMSISIPVGSTGVTVYAPDGRTTVVQAKDVDAYTAVGWYKTYEETVQTVYAMDGRSLTVFKADVPAYLQVGWYATYEETVATLYAMDGRSLTVPKPDVPAFLQVGWYLTKEETVETLYAMDGRSLTVPKTEVPLYLQVGWYLTKEETMQTLYAADGRTLSVPKADVPAFLMVGWSATPLYGPMVALTFDDGPHGIHTNMILDTLEAYGAKATFFVLGLQAEMYPAALSRIAALGCEIGNHTYGHRDLLNSSTWRIRDEITKTNALVRAATGQDPTLMRPPYGNHNASVRGTVGLPTVLWNVDPQDWNHKSAAKVAEHVLSRASDGDIILMHDIYGSTAEAVKTIVPTLLARGFRLVTVSELAAAKGIKLQAGNAYYGF